MRRLPLRLALAAALVLSGLAPAFATSLTPPLPLAIEDDESVATTDDARAMLFDPAGVGVRYPWETTVGFARFDPHHEWNTFLASRGGMGFYALRQRDTSQTYGLAFAFGSEKLRFGWSPYWLASGRPSREVDGDHRIGLLSRPAPWLSLGGTIDHLEQPIFRGQRRARHYTLGAGWRPFAMSREHAWTLGTRFTLSGDVTLVDDGDWRQARVRVAGELEPVPGLLLRGTVADHRNVRLGITLRGVGASVHAGHAAEDGRTLYQTYAVSLHGGEERTVFAGRGDRRVAVVRVGGVLADEAMGGTSLMGGPATVAAGPIHRQLERALEDPLTRGVLLDLRGAGNMAQLEELRPRIERLRAAGKPVLAYMEYGGGRGDLYLASACDRVMASEEADFMGLGLRSERRYWRQALANLGVKVERSSIGRFKSAYRQFSVDSMPPADSLATQHELDQRQQLFVDAVSAGRHIAPERLATFLDGRAWPPADLVRGGILDSIGYREDALAALGRMTRLGATPRTVNLARARAAQRAWTVPARIAVVWAGGGIGRGRSGSDLLEGPYMGDVTMSAQIERAFRAPGVKAVVLRVESPGGDALASNLIDHAVQRWKGRTHKPLVVSMGSVAGSGGYYIACHGDVIYADRFTRTGSIGVLTVKPSFEGLYAKLKVRQQSFDRGDFMGALSYSRDWRPQDQASADSAIARSYDMFVGKVAEGRRLDPALVRESAQGRVWMGEDARERSLVDSIGGLEDAIAEARRRAGIPAGERIRRLEFGRPRGPWFERLLGNWVRESLAREARLPDWDGVQARDPDWAGPAAD